MDSQVTSRLDAAVEFLRDSNTFKVGEYVVGMLDRHTVFVNCYSSYTYIDSMTRELAFAEFMRMRTHFISLIHATKVFAQFVQAKKIQYNLVLDTGGAGVTVCTEMDGKTIYLLD